MKVYEMKNSFGLDHVRVSERQIPVPGTGEVLIQMRAASLNYRDLGVINGFYNPNLKLPFIPVSDGVGEVVGLGEQSSRFKLGDRVSGIFTQSWISGEPTQEDLVSTLGNPLEGLLAEYVVLNEKGLVRVPDHLNDAEAASLACAGVTAWNAVVQEGKVKSGDTVLVQGTGGVSLFALQFAKLHGATVIITSSSDDKLARAKSLGADFGVNYSSTPDWAEAVLEITHGRGADLVVDVGGAATLNRSLQAIRIGGQISIIGILSGARVESFDIITALVKQARLQGIYVGSRNMFEAMNHAIEQNALHPVIDRIFPFEQSVDALRYLAKGTHFGKVCITF